jgi:hypothetical protein
MQTTNLPPPPRPLKRCARCGLSKPFSNFYANCTKVDGVQTYCKECNKETQRNGY